MKVESEVEMFFREQSDRKSTYSQEERLKARGMVSRESKYFIILLYIKKCNTSKNILKKNFLKVALDDFVCFGNRKV